MELRDVEGYIADNLYKALTLIMSAGFFIGLHEGYATNNGAEITVAYILDILPAHRQVKPPLFYIGLICSTGAYRCIKIVNLTPW